MSLQTFLDSTKKLHENSHIHSSHICILILAHYVADKKIKAQLENLLIGALGKHEFDTNLNFLKQHEGKTLVEELEDRIAALKYIFDHVNDFSDSIESTTFNNNNSNFHDRDLFVKVLKVLCSLITGQDMRLLKDGFNTYINNYIQTNNINRVNFNTMAMILCVFGIGVLSALLGALTGGLAFGGGAIALAAAVGWVCGVTVSGLAGGGFVVGSSHYKQKKFDEEMTPHYNSFANTKANFFQPANVKSIGSESITQNIKQAFDDLISPDLPSKPTPMPLPNLLTLD